MWMLRKTHGNYGGYNDTWGWWEEDRYKAKHFRSQLFNKESEWRNRRASGRENSSPWCPPSEAHGYCVPDGAGTVPATFIDSGADSCCPWGAWGAAPSELEALAFRCCFFTNRSVFHRPHRPVVSPKHDARSKSILWTLRVRCAVCSCPVNHASWLSEILDVEGTKPLRRKLVYENVINDDPHLLLGYNSFI